MREVNAAWQVLRSPADRAAYDDQLRGEADAVGLAGDERRLGRRRASRARPPSFDGQLVEPAAARRPRRAPAATAGPVGAGADRGRAGGRRLVVAGS